jgi:retron-type reverse transcriptase
MISAAPYRDRVVHHALCNVIAPVFERTFIDHSYANRLGFGTHRALRRFTELARSHRYILQCDIRKYFPSIDHEILKTIIRRKIKCRDTLWLIETIIDASNPQEEMLAYFPDDDLWTPHERRRGLPIGNLTSQFFANIYLNPFDHFVTKELRTAKYVRYVDDFALFSDDRAWLTEARVKIETWLTKLRLQIHGVKSQLFETRHGASFVGFQVLPETVRVKNENLRRARRRMKHLQKAYRRGEKDLQQITQCVRSWIAHLEHGNTWQLRTRIFNALAFVSG